MTLDPTPAANLPTSDVPGWVVVGCLAALAACYWLAAARTWLPLLVLLTALIGVCAVWAVV